MHCRTVIHKTNFARDAHQSKYHYATIISDFFHIYGSSPSANTDSDFVFDWCPPGRCLQIPTGGGDSDGSLT